MGSRVHGLQELRLMGLVAPRYVGSSQTRDLTHVPCVGRWILNIWTTREVPEICLPFFFFFFKLFCFFNKPNFCVHCLSFPQKANIFSESLFGKAAIWLHWFITSMDMNLTPWMEISHLTATWEERPPSWMLAFYGAEQVHRDSWWEENGPYLSVSDRPAECVGCFLRLWRMGRERGRPGERGLKIPYGKEGTMARPNHMVFYTMSPS